MTASVYSRTFQKAVALCGGLQKLARRLKVPVSELKKWIADKSVPPKAVFLRAVDLVIDETPAPPGGNGDVDVPPAPRECAPGESARH